MMTNHKTNHTTNFFKDRMGIPLRLIRTLSVLALLAASLIAPHSAEAQCNLDRRSVTEVDDSLQIDSFTTVAFTETRMYAEGIGNEPTRFQMVTYDITNPDNPVFIGESPLQEDPFFNGVDSVALGTLFISAPGAGSGLDAGTLLVYEMADPNNPQLVGSLDLPGRIGALELGGNIVYALSTARLDAISVADPANPVSIGTLALSSTTSTVDLLGAPQRDILPVSSGSTTDLVDISDPTNMAILGSVSSDFLYPTIVGNAVVGVSGNILTIADITDPTNPILLPNYDLTSDISTTQGFLGGRATGFVFYTFEIDTAGGKIIAYDFADPANPIFVDQVLSYPNAETGSVSLEQRGNLLLAHGSIALGLVDTSSCAILPTITLNPASQSTTEGGSPVMLSAAATGALQLEWRLNGQPIADGATYSGAATDTLTIQPLLAASGTYELVASNADGQVVSLPAVVGVTPLVNDPTGACYFSSSACVIVTEASCHTGGGIYGGDETDCMFETPTITNITQSTMHPTLSDAIDNSNPADVIEIGAGRLVEWGMVLSDRDITIRGQGRDATIIDATYMGRVFKLQGGDESTFEDLTIRRGVPIEANGGGAVRVVAANAVFRRVDFRECDGTGFGSAAIAGDNSNAVMTFESCQFIDNQNGGVASVTNGGSYAASFINCLFARNGGSIHTVALRDNCALVNCTFADNSDDWVLRGGNATISIDNCVFDDSNPSGISRLSLPPANYSLLPGGTGTNIDGLPTFVDAASGDYRLAEGSLGIDAADYDVYIAQEGGSVDLKNEGRAIDNDDVVDTGIGALTYLDMGAYELQVGTTPPDFCLGDMNSDGAIDGLDTQLFVAALLEGTTCP